jgi:hypothetical protein
LQASDQLTFNTWIASEAHERRLSVGLKNDLDQVEELYPYFDWALNEQCFECNECNRLLPFVEAGKAVFGVREQWWSLQHLLRNDYRNLTIGFQARQRTDSRW